MCDKSAFPIYISVDLKKFRIRVYKTALHLLGNPENIQFLIHPENCVIAIKATDREMPKEQTHRVPLKRLESDNSVEFYSRTFISKMIEVLDEIDTGCSYRMAGEFFPKENMILFSLKNMIRISS